MKGKKTVKNGKSGHLWTHIWSWHFWTGKNFCKLSRPRAWQISTSNLMPDISADTEFYLYGSTTVILTLYNLNVYEISLNYILFVTVITLTSKMEYTRHGSDHRWSHQDICGDLSNSCQLAIILIVSAKVDFYIIPRHQGNSCYQWQWLVRRWVPLVMSHFSFLLHIYY